VGEVPDIKAVEEVRGARPKREENILFSGANIRKRKGEKKGKLDRTNPGSAGELALDWERFNLS